MNIHTGQCQRYLVLSFGISFKEGTGLAYACKNQGRILIRMTDEKETDRSCHLVDESEIKQLVKATYCLTVESCFKLKGFEDANYRVQVKDKEGTSRDAVFKMLSTSEIDDKMTHLKAQFSVMQHLVNTGFTCSVPVYSPYNTAVHVSESKSASSIPRRHLFYMLTYIPGHVVLDEPMTTERLSELGELQAHMHISMQDFRHPALCDVKEDNIWQMENLSLLRQFMSCIQDEDKHKLIESVIQKFEENVLPVVSQLSKSVVWNDFHDENIIAVDGMQAAEVKRKYGLIDFGDVSYSCLLFDMAIALTFLMIDSTNISYLKTPGYFLSGYHKVSGNFNRLAAMFGKDSNEHFPRGFFELLYHSVCGRYALSLVLGLYFHQDQPDNDYLLCTQQGWPQLAELFNIDKDKLYTLWSENISSL